MTPSCLSAMPGPSTKLRRLPDDSGSASSHTNDTVQVIDAACGLAWPRLAANLVDGTAGALAVAHQRADSGASDIRTFGQIAGGFARSPVRSRISPLHGFRYTDCWLRCAARDLSSGWAAFIDTPCLLSSDQRPAALGTRGAGLPWSNRDRARRSAYRRPAPGPASTHATR